LSSKVGSGFNDFVDTDPDWAKMLDADPDWQPCKQNSKNIKKEKNANTGTVYYNKDSQFLNLLWKKELIFSTVFPYNNTDMDFYALVWYLYLFVFYCTGIL
jgi:hypothetical protein